MKSNEKSVEEIAARLMQELQEIDRERDEAIRKRDEFNKRAHQYENRINREINKTLHLAKGNRKKRIHYFCLRGGTIEHMIPEFKVLTDEELFSLMGSVSKLPEFKNLLKGFMKNHQKNLSCGDGDDATMDEMLAERKGGD